MLSVYRTDDREVATSAPRREAPDAPLTPAVFRGALFPTRGSVLWKSPAWLCSDASDFCELTRALATVSLHTRGRTSGQNERSQDRLVNLGLNVQMSLLIPRNSPTGGDRRGQTGGWGADGGQEGTRGQRRWKPAALSPTWSCSVGPAVLCFLGDLRGWPRCGRWSLGGLLSTCTGISMTDGT